MELGLGSGLDKIGDHLGRRWAKAAAILMFVGLVVLVGHEVFVFFALPIYGLMSGHRLDPVFWDNLGSMASPLWTVCLILLLIYLSFVDTERARRDREKLKEVEKLVAELEARLEARDES